jgi:hypothetical protein
MTCSSCTDYMFGVSTVDALSRRSSHIISCHTQNNFRLQSSSHVFSGVTSIEAWLKFLHRTTFSIFDAEKELIGSLIHQIQFPLFSPYSCPNQTRRNVTVLPKLLMHTSFIYQSPRQPGQVCVLHIKMDYATTSKLIPALRYRGNVVE